MMPTKEGEQGCTICIAVAMVVIGILDAIALLMGINGVVMLLSVATVAGLGGYGAGYIRRVLNYE